jgi:hypothetical protein
MRLNIVDDNLPAARRAAAFRLAALVRNGEIVVGLPPRRDPQVSAVARQRRRWKRAESGLLHLAIWTLGRDRMLQAVERVASSPALPDRQ